MLRLYPLHIFHGIRDDELSDTTNDDRSSMLANTLLFLPDHAPGLLLKVVNVVLGAKPDKQR